MSRLREEEELTRFYEELDDDRLLELASKPDDLTPLAGDLVGREIRRRKLSLVSADGVPRSTASQQGAPEPPQPQVASSDANGLIATEVLWYERPGDYATLAAEDCCFPLPEQPELRRTRVALTLAGIPFDEHVPRPAFDAYSRSDLRMPFLAVRPNDRDRARALLGAAWSREVLTQAAAEDADADDWGPPTCPRCSAPNALLVSVEPANRWLCDECGHRWQDAA